MPITRTDLRWIREQMTALRASAARIRATLSTMDDPDLMAREAERMDGEADRYARIDDALTGERALRTARTIPAPSGSPTSPGSPPRSNLI